MAAYSSPSCSATRSRLRSTSAAAASMARSRRASSSLDGIARTNRRGMRNPSLSRTSASPMATPGETAIPCRRSIAPSLWGAPAVRGGDKHPIALEARARAGATSLRATRPRAPRANAGEAPAHVWRSRLARQPCVVGRRRMVASILGSLFGRCVRLPPRLGSRALHVTTSANLGMPDFPCGASLASATSPPSTASRHCRWSAGTCVSSDTKPFSMNRASASTASSASSPRASSRNFDARFGRQREHVQDALGVDPNAFRERLQSSHWNFIASCTNSSAGRMCRPIGILVADHHDASYRRR